jgi:histone H4
MITNNRNVVSPTFSQHEAVSATQAAQIGTANDFSQALAVSTTHRGGMALADLLRQHEQRYRQRHRPISGRNRYLRDNIQNITKSDIRRLARRGGVKRISGGIYEEARSSLKIHLEQIINIATTYTEHARRKTVSAMDIVHALKHIDRTLYGFGG